MYFPYLRGKQFELLALRELSTELQGNFNFTPIVEPVKQTLTGLKSTIDSMLKKELNFALVLNPYEGDFKRGIGTNLLEKIPCLRQFPEFWIPAFIFHTANIDSIEYMIRTENLNHVMAIFPEPINTQDSRLTDFLNTSPIEYIVVPNGDYRTEIMNLFSMFQEKNFIRLDNNFKGATRNADYILQEDELFTEQHLYYKADHFYGFGDYTALPKNFTEGGMIPFSIAIHLTYQKADRVINIHHFVSDTNEDRSNIQGKFFEAVQKIKAFYEGAKSPMPTSAVKELIQLITEPRYPGLGYLKKLSIKNSIQLMNRILNSKNEGIC